MTLKPATLFINAVIILCSTLNTIKAQTPGDTILQNETVTTDRVSKKIDSTLRTGWYYISDTPTVFKRQLDKTEEYYFINPSPIVSAKNIEKVENAQQSGFESPWHFAALYIQLDSSGTKAWYEATKKSVGKKLAFIVFNRLMQIIPIRFENRSGGITFHRQGYGEAELHLIKMAIGYSK